jgi:hypothetical protein
LKDELPQFVPGRHSFIVVTVRMGVGETDGQRGNAFLTLAIGKNGRVWPSQAVLLRESNSCIAAAGGMLATSAKTTAFLEASPDRLASSFVGIGHGIIPKTRS